MSIVKGNHAGLGGAGAPGGPLAGGGVYNYSIDQSLRFDDASNAYLNKTYTTAQTNTDKITASFWFKLSEISTTRMVFLHARNGGGGEIKLNSHKIYANLFDTGYDGFYNNALLRDPSAWYHLVYQGNSTLSTAADRNRVWLNGVELENNATSYTQQNTDTYFLRNGLTSNIGRNVDNSSYDMDGYMAEIHVIDGTIVDVSNFGETINGVWVPKEYDTAYGAYGNNGFYLPFSQDFTAGNSINFGTSRTATVTYSDASSYDIGASDDFTIEYFFKTQDVGANYGNWMGNYAVSGPHHLISYDFRSSTRDVYFYSGNGQGLKWAVAGDVTLSNGTWHHVVFQRDGTTLRAYIDGTRLTSVSNSSSSWSLSDGKATNFNKAYDLSQIIIGDPYGQGMNGSLSNVRYVIGDTVYADDDSDITVPTETLTAVTGTKLLTAVNATLGDDISTENNDGSVSSATLSYDSPFTTQNFYDDASGNGNDWTANNLAASDVVPDSPTNNWSTLNPLKKNNTTQTFAEGNLDFSSTQTSTNPAVTSTFAVTTGKWYWEVYIRNDAGSNSVGIAKNPNNLENDSTALYNSPDSYQYQTDGNKRNNSSSTSYGDAWTTGDIIGVALDLDAGAVYFYKNGTIQNSGTAAYTGLSGEFTSYSLVYQSGAQVYNFGQDDSFADNKTSGSAADSDSEGLGTFYHSVPSGYKSLCASNLPEPTIGPNSTEQTDDYFETILYTGNGSGQSIGSGGVQHPQDTTTIANSLRFNSADPLYFSKVTGSDGNRQIWTFSAWVKRGTFPSSTIQTIFSEGSSGSSLAMHVYDNTFYVQERNSGSNRFVHQTDVVAGAAGTWYHLVYAVDTTQATQADRIKLYVDGVLQTLNAIGGNSVYPDKDLNTNINFGGNHYIGYGATQNKYWDGYLAEVYMIDGQQLEPTTFGQVGSNGYWIPKAVSGLTFGDEGYYLDFEDNSSASALGTDDSGIGNNFTPSAGIETTDQVIDSPTQNFATWDPNNKYNYNAPSEGNLRALTAGNNGTQRSNVKVTSGKWYFEVRNGSAGSGSLARFVGVSKDGTTISTIPYNNADNYLYYSLNGNTYSGGSSVSYGDSWQTDGDVIGVAFDADNGAIWFSKNGTWQNSATAAEIAAGTTTNAAFTGISGTYFMMVSRTGGTSSNDPHHANFGQDPTFSGDETAPGTDKTDANGRGKFLYDVPTNFLALVDDNIPQEGLESPDFVWIKERNNNSKSHYLFDTVRGVTKNLHADDTAVEATDTDSLLSFDYQGFTVGSNGDVNGSADTYVAWDWKAGGPSPTQTYTVTVADDSGQNKYRFDGNTTFAPTLNLQEGGTYTFDWSAATTHPFSFSTTSDGTHNSGTEYTTGVVKDTDAHTTTITVAHGAPTLYYYCSTHSGMGGQANTNTTHGSSNFDGSIQSVVSAATDAGFSIVSWTGTQVNATVGHGLAETPEIVIVKNRDYGSGFWTTWTKFNTNDNILGLDLNNALFSSPGSFIEGDIDDTTIGVGTERVANGLDEDMIAYCFHSVDGFSKIGKYTGNNSTDGPFNYTGFRPAWVMLKRTDSTASWLIYDDKRDTFNQMQFPLFADLPDDEYTSNLLHIDFLSNGFKVRNDTYGETNASSGTYIFLAFAEQPFKYANAR